MIFRQTLKTKEYGRNRRIYGKGTGGAASMSSAASSESIFSKYFELVDNNGNPYIRAKYSFASDGEVMTYAQNPDMPASIWDAMPKATASVLGAIKVGNNLTVDADGTLHAQASGGASSWSELSDIPAWLAHATQAAFEAGHGHDWDNISGKPSTYAPSAHSHSWSSITSKPSTFAPSAHEHPISEVTGLQSALDAKAALSHNHDAAYHPKGGDSALAFACAALNVYGEISYINSQTIIVDDAFVQVNTGNAAVDAGLIADNGTTLGARLFWDVSAAAWACGNNGAYNHILTTADLGSGKGLDADTLDGYEAAAFPRKAETATIPGLWTFNQRIKLSSQWAIGYDGTDIVFYNANGVKKAKIDQDGNLTATGEVTAYGTV